MADSEGSSIRTVPFKTGTLEVAPSWAPIIWPRGRLFTFGDVDGPRTEAKLQHCLDVAFHDGKIYVADTYNNKIKVVNAKTGETKTLAGTGKPGTGDSPAEFHEPAGLTHAKGKLYVADTNNHLIRTIDLASGKVSTLKIEGLEPPGKPVAGGAVMGRTARLLLYGRLSRRRRKKLRCNSACRRLRAIDSSCVSWPKTGLGCVAARF